MSLFPNHSSPESGPDYSFSSFFRLSDQYRNSDREKLRMTEVRRLWLNDEIVRLADAKKEENPV
jgi:hypothetical protein